MLAVSFDASVNFLEYGPLLIALPCLIRLLVVDIREIIIITFKLLLYPRANQL
jgi:hypothetical protein